MVNELVWCLPNIGLLSNWLDASTFPFVCSEMSFLKWAAAGAAIAYFSFYFGLAQRAIGHLALYMEQQKMKLVKEMRPKRIIIMRHAESGLMSLK